MTSAPTRHPTRRALLASTAALAGVAAGQSALPAFAAAPPDPFGADAIDAAIRRGDIVTAAYDPAPAVGRYQGNGRFGCVYGKLGLHAHPAERASADPWGKTQFMHMRHWGRFAFRSKRMERDTTADYLIPLARIYWEQSPAGVSDYRQHQSFLDGMLDTRFRTTEGHIAVTTWFDGNDRDLAGIKLTVRERAPAIILDATELFVPYAYGDNRPARHDVRVTREQGQWRLDITCAATSPAVRSTLYLHTGAAVEPCPQGVRIMPAEGETQILLSYGKPVAPDAPAASRARTAAHWRDTWRTSATFRFPDDAPSDALQAMWVRSMAYILSTFNDDGIGFAPTNGLTGNLFPFNFAQDMLYVHSALLMTGHVAVLKAWMERFHAMIPGMEAYARRLWPGVEGLYPPWELPFGPVEGYHAPSVPIIYCYEPHNAGYLSRMAHETASALNDPRWTRTVARPLIAGVASYFGSFCRKGADGRWHFELKPAVGQDEAGGRDQRDYLDVLYSAEYSFARAVEHGLDPGGQYAAILRDGLAYPALLAPQGFYYTSAGAGARDFGSQKHPVQLNGLAHLPVAPEPSPPERAAYRLRHDLTQDAKKPYFHGWTLGELLLAGTRIGDAAGWREDWANIARSRYGDPGGVQIYETSDSPFKAFYVTTHGLIASSLMENLVSDYWGPVAIGGCDPGMGSSAFRNVRTPAGLALDGEIAGTRARVSIRADRDSAVTVSGERLELREGETRTIMVSVSPSASRRK